MKYFLMLLMMLISLSSNADFVYPVGDPDERPMPTGFPNTNGFQVTREFNEEDHTGIDLSNNSEGGDVRSVTDGTVIVRCDAADPADTSACSGFGNVLVIQHDLPDDTYYSLYAHLKHGSLLVGVSSTVTTRQIIAEVNCTGYSIGSSRCESNGGNGPHLHFAVKKKGQIGCAYVGPNDCKNSGETINDYVHPLDFIEDRSADIRTVYFEGTINSIRPSGDADPPNIDVGDRIWGTYNLRLDAPESDQTSDDEDFGLYFDSVTDVDINVGPYSFFNIDSDEVSIRNNDPDWGGDVYGIYMYQNVGGSAAGWTPSTFVLQLLDPSASAFSSDGLPTTAPSPDDFDSDDTHLAMPLEYYEGDDWQGAFDVTASFEHHYFID